MEITLEQKKRRQAILAGCLLMLVVGLGVFDFRGSWAPAPAAATHTEIRRTQHASAKAGPVSASPSSFHLSSDLLARSEGYDYAATAHDLFGSQARAAIEAPAAPPRPTAVVAPTVLATEKSDPPFDVKFAGFVEGETGKLSALFIRGDDIAVARTGDIIFHRFRVGAIQATSAQLTDLESKRIQALAATEK
jgi:hypothetical protein